MTSRFNKSSVHRADAVPRASLRKSHACENADTSMHRMPRELLLALLIMLTAAVLLAGHVRDLAQAAGLF